MPYKTHHIILSILLTAAVTDYVWIEFLKKDKSIVIELEAEKEAGEEEIKEVQRIDTKEESFGLVYYCNQFLEPTVVKRFSGFIKIGNSFLLLTKGSYPKFYILYSSLRIHYLKV